MANIGAKIPIKTEDCCICWVIAPESWVETVRSCIDQLRRGRYWNKTTGNIKQAQTTGIDIAESFMACSCVTLDDLLETIRSIDVSLAALVDKQPVVVSTYPVTIEVPQQTIEVTQQTIEVTQQTIEVTQQTVEVTQQTVEVTQQTIEVTQQAIDLTGIKDELNVMNNYLRSLQQIRDGINSLVEAQLACCCLEGQFYDPTLPYVIPKLPEQTENPNNDYIHDPLPAYGGVRLTRCPAASYFLTSTIDILRFLSRNLQLLGTLVYLNSLMAAVMYLISDVFFPSFFRKANSLQVIDQNTLIGGQPFGKYTGILVNAALSLGAEGLDLMASVIEDAAEDFSCELAGTSPDDNLSNMFYELAWPVTLELDKAMTIVNLIIGGSGSLLYRETTDLPDTTGRVPCACWLMVFDKVFLPFDGRGTATKTITVFFETTRLVSETYIDTSGSNVVVTIVPTDVTGGINVTATFDLNIGTETRIKILLSTLEV